MQMDPFKAQFRGQVISNFALTHFAAAKCFASKVREIENAHVGQSLGNFGQEISIYCVSCIIVAVASLEALINELFIAPGPLRESEPNFDKYFWGGEGERGLGRESILAKYKEAMSILHKPALSKDEDFYKNTEALIWFRNYLIHFKPLWDDERRNDRLEDQLDGKFDLSPFFSDDGAGFLATKCMSAGCAEWAVRTVAEFVQEFGKRSSLDPKKLSMFKV